MNTNPSQPEQYDAEYFANETPEQKQARTEHWRGLLRQSLLNDLPYQHKMRWARIAAEIRHRIRTAPNEEAKAGAEQELQVHYKDHFNPESSREALLAEIDTRELPAPGL